MVLALWLRGLSYGWPATLGLAAFTWVALPFVISQFCAVFVLRRMWRADRLADKIADAVKGLPPREQAAVAKRMIDEALK